jgi:phage FluMu protein Com
MEISKKCPRCQRDYSRDPYWKSSLQKHLARKNPCDRKNKYIREARRKQETPTQTDEEVSGLFQMKRRLRPHEYLTFYERGNGMWEVSFVTKNPLGITPMNII